MQEEEHSSLDEGTSEDTESVAEAADVPRQRSSGSVQSASRTPEPKAIKDPVPGLSDTDASDEEEYERDDVLAAFLNTKMLLHTRLAIPTDIEMPPYRLLGVLSRSNPELWGHVLATLANEWCCAYLNTSGGMLMIGVESDGTIEGIPLNTHHSQLHSFLTPLFSTLDGFWPPITEGLISVSLLPVCTPVGDFDPYYVIMIRVKRGPMPCYINSAGVCYEGDHVLEEIADRKSRMSLVNTNQLAKYLTTYSDERARKALMMSDVIRGKTPFVFNYSSHWSHPPLTLIPETATSTMLGATVKIEGDTSVNLKLKPPCNHAQWTLGSLEGSAGKCRVSLVCNICKNHWKFAAKDTFENLRCIPFSEGNCQSGSSCRLIHVQMTPSIPAATGGGTPSIHPLPGKKKKPKRENSGPPPLSGLMRGPPVTDEPPRPQPRIVPTVPPELMNVQRVQNQNICGGISGGPGYQNPGLNPSALQRLQTDEDLSHSDHVLTPKSGANTPRKRKRGNIKQKPRPKSDNN